MYAHESVDDVHALACTCNANVTVDDVHALAGTCARQVDKDFAVSKMDFISCAYTHVTDVSIYRLRRL